MRPAALCAAALVVLLLALGPADRALAAPAAPAAALGPMGPAAAMGTAFTYQGQLLSSGAPVNDTCDFGFKLYDAQTGGSLLGAIVRTGIAVTGGLFTVSDVDFGSGKFGGDERWLEVLAACPAGSGSYITIGSRQALTPTPYALHAGTRPWPTPRPGAA